MCGAAGAYWCFTTNCTQRLVAEGRRYLKIDGLWGVLPLEVLGFSITEPGSAFFSLVHIPVILYLLRGTYDPEVLARVKPGHPFLHPYRWVLVQATVTWALSTYYHSYHTTWSEHLDYYGANALLLTYLVPETLQAVPPPPTRAQTHRLSAYGAGGG